MIGLPFGRARTHARALLEKLGLQDSTAVPVAAVAHALSAEIHEGDLADSRAVLRRVGSGASIRVSDYTSSSWDRRFSIAHEIGHLVLDHKAPVNIECEESLRRCFRNPRVEREANTFAAEILMPTERLRAESADAHASFDTVRRLAGLFGVPVHFAAIRFVEVTHRPCALVCAMGGRAKWVVSSPAFGHRVRPGAVIRPGSLAHRCVRDRRLTHRDVVDSLSWYEAQQAHDVVEEVLPLRSGGETLSLLCIPKMSVLIERAVDVFGRDDDDYCAHRGRKPQRFRRRDFESSGGAEESGDKDDEPGGDVAGGSGARVMPDWGS